MTTFASDSPIKDPELDQFNRWPFAQRIAQTIVSRKDPSSIVIGIYGSWGDGKTTVLNFIDKELRKHTDIIPINFNPWRFSDENDMLLGFFHYLANIVGKSELTIKERLGEFIGKLQPIGSTFGQGETLVGLSKLLSSVELVEIKNRVNEFLKDEGKRVVVLIDDIDRLDKNEIQFLFRLVKLNADFINTAYILAFDDDMVAAALQEKYSAAGSESGRGFLEKIIQVPLDLPAIPTTLLREFCFSKVEQSLIEGEIKLSQDETHTFIRGYIDGLEIRVKTPRMATRYGNILSFSLPLLKGEVYPVDLMLVEGIRVFYPRLYESIKRNPDIFLGSRLSYVTGSNEENERKRVKDIIDRGISDLNLEEKQNVLKLIQAIFPQLERIYGNTYYASDMISTWTKLKRVASKDYFDRYFSYSILQSDVSDILIEQFMNSLENKSESELIESFMDLFKTNNQDKVILKFRQKSDKLPPSSSIMLAFLIAGFGHNFPKIDQLFSFQGSFSQAAMLVSDLLENIPNKEEKIKYSQILVTKAEPITFAVEIVRWIRGANQDGNPNRLTLEEISALKKILANRISQLAYDKKLLSEYPDEAYRLLSIWSHWGQKEEMLLYIDSIFKQDPNQINVIISSIITTEWDMYTEIGKKANLTRDEYDSLNSILIAEKIMMVLEELYGEELFTDEYPYDISDENVELRLAQQFAWIHKNILKESQ